jgi:tetratricopeptide (TPR) repeat protein
MIASARGDYDAAQDWYDRAETLFSGHWLTALYRAEASLSNGQADSAVAALERVARDHDRPEAMDMLGLVWRVRGDIAQSRAWTEKSGAIWREWADKYPAAFAAHAAEHELVFGNAAEALRLARINTQARPYGEARLLLARALMANDQARAALKEIGLAERSGWRSAQLFAIKAQALMILGETHAAEVADEQARAINPKIDDPVTRLIWLAHG